MSEFEVYFEIGQVIAAGLLAGYVVLNVWQLGWTRGVLPAVAAGSIGPWLALVAPSVSVASALEVSFIASGFVVLTIANWPALRPAAGESLSEWLGLREPRR